MRDVRLITLAPGHFHAALIQKRMPPGVAPRVHVYAPLDDDLVAHLRRVAAFNARADDPTAWELEVHAGPDFLERMVREKPGDVVVLAGRNRRKIDFLLAAADAGLHVLADKPWVIEAEDFPKLERLRTVARQRRVLVYDVMTERYEVTTILQRSLVADREVFGAVLLGSPERPAVFLRSVHYLRKRVAGVPLLRPAWFFDVREQGEALADVGTHLVDLVMWVLFPAEPIDHAADVRLISAERWPVELDREQFREVTGLPDFPAELAADVAGDRLRYPCNNRVVYALRGVHVRLDVVWDYEALEGGGDLHHAEFSGTRSTVAVRQQPAEGGQPELFVRPNAAGDWDTVREAVRRKVAEWQASFPGVGLEDRGGELRVVIPAAYRVGHEAHFAQVLDRFLALLRDPGLLPEWEWANLLAKYRTTTGGVALARGK